MPVAVEFNADTKDIMRKLQKLGKLDDLTTPLKRSGTHMEKSIGSRFRGANWTPLSPRTYEIHPHRMGGKPLNDTGKLKASVTSKAVRQLSKKQLKYGSNLKYAPLHNFGGRAGWGTYIPQREFLNFESKDEQAIKRIFEDYVKELGS
ncbi:hypothetical protein BpsS36_00014 [Bacillus phage vB_BpsS-36]|uniref:Uncharacterized protein n=1 Tax=Bacillus phage vB_BpsS-36 TaxID=2419622 RepID=A0A3G3BX14_9CAUD|nr:hypothetical protein BpsS36_00014 [Bacillus phage vB_BpsS-36]